jgi:hypothetical protein
MDTQTPALVPAVRWFVDRADRRVLLRGVNLGGSSKVPVQPPGATHLPHSLDAQLPISFVGRPFPLHEADEHFARVQRWGFNAVRLLATWEAIAHAGPGQYDAEYLAYLAAIVARAAAYGLYVLIDMHQDAWGRWSGGDGAPHWAYTAVGLDPSQFDACEAACTMQRRLPHYPPMSWTGNSARFAARTMVTLLLAGDDVAPELRIDGEPAQTFLQRHFLAAVARLAHALRDLPKVIGYGFLNELGTGYLGTRLDMPLPTPIAGARLSGFDGMVLAAGIPRRIPHYRAVGMLQLPSGSRRLNVDEARAWLPGAPDIWQQAGIWAIHDGSQVLLRPEHFCQVGGRTIDAFRDYVLPFARRFAAVVQRAHPGAAVFVENGVLGEQPRHDWRAAGITNLVNATHWYDAVTLFSRRAMPGWSYDVYGGRFVLGGQQVQRMFSAQIARLAQASAALMGDCPTVIGEFGVPFDLDDGRMLRRGDYHAQVAFLDRYFNALDANLVGGMLWNYTADNDHRWGDQWNREDLSIFSRDELARGGDGGRAVAGFCRPYARATAGTPLHMSFDQHSGAFTFQYEADPRVAAPTDIFVPEVQYPQGCAISVSSGRVRYNALAQTLLIDGAAPGTQQVLLRRSG